MGETDRESRGRYWRSSGHRRGHSALALSFGRQKRTCGRRSKIWRRRGPPSLRSQPRSGWAGGQRAYDIKILPGGQACRPPGHVPRSGQRSGPRDEVPAWTRLALICAYRPVRRHALACASVSRVLLCHERFACECVDWSSGYAQVRGRREGRLCTGPRFVISRSRVQVPPPAPFRITHFRLSHDGVAEHD